MKEKSEEMSKSRVGGGRSGMEERDVEAGNCRNWGPGSQIELGESFGRAANGSCNVAGVFASNHSQGLRCVNVQKIKSLRSLRR
jgi:hypothetical protein